MSTKIVEIPKLTNIIKHTGQDHLAISIKKFYKLSPNKRILKHM